MKATIKNFLQMESAGGVVLMAAAALALVAANSPLADYYDLFIETPVEVRVGGFEIAKPLLLWVNDGLMAVFFFLVGLEVKRELLEGELSRPSNVLLPALGAVGGIVAPVGLYVLFNYGDSVGMNGWAIPAATDIAFALGILMILGKRVPVSLKVFLVSLAIFDDLGAIVIIAIFYSSNLSINALVVASACLVILGYLNWRHVSSVPAYVLVGVVMWVAVLKSGVHATLAGVALAMFIPMRSKEEPDRSRPAHGSGVRRIAAVRLRQCRHSVRRHELRGYPAPGIAGHRGGIVCRQTAGRIPAVPGGDKARYGKTA